jgi:hypothetical protein
MSGAKPASRRSGGAGSSGAPGDNRRVWIAARAQLPVAFERSAARSAPPHAEGDLRKPQEISETELSLEGRALWALCGGRAVPALDRRRPSTRPQRRRALGRTLAREARPVRIVENATPALAFSVLQGFAERPLRHYEAEMEAAHRSLPSRSALERIGKRVGVRIREAPPLGPHDRAGRCAGAVEPRRRLARTRGANRDGKADRPIPRRRAARPGLRSDHIQHRRGSRPVQQMARAARSQRHGDRSHLPTPQRVGGPSSCLDGPTAIH